MKRKMNKPISLILAVLMIIATFTGCAGGETGASPFAGAAEDTGPLKICVDLGTFREIYEPSLENQKIKRDQHHAMTLFEADFKAYLQMTSLEPIEL